MRAADAWIDTEAIRVTLWEAAWRIDTGRPAAEAVAVAKWWASEAGQRVVHAYAASSRRDRARTSSTRSTVSSSGESRSS